MYKQNLINKLVDNVINITGCTKEIAQSLIDKLLLSELLSRHPIKEAELKHDLYEVEEQTISYGLYSSKTLSKLGNKILDKGTKFIYFDTIGWCDDIGYGIEGMNDNFAKEHLINIRKYGG